MRCTDPAPRLLRAAAAATLCLLAGCHAVPSAVPAASAASAATREAGAVPAPGPANGGEAAAASYRRPARTIAEYRLQVAARLIAANPAITYTTPAPDPLLAIPVLEVEVDGDGNIRHITVLRVPTEADDTVQIAIAALERAAPFGDATHLPRPWKFTEVFLFDEDRRFKPRILD